MEGDNKGVEIFMYTKVKEENVKGGGEEGEQREGSN